MNRFAIAALVVLSINAAFTAHLAPLASAPLTVLSYAVSFLPYVAILWCIRHRSFDGIAPLIVTAIGIRCVLLFAEPLLSDDIYRYIWEGRVTLAGFNPFVLAPDSPELSALRDGIWSKVNHPQIPTIYPPVSQGVFALVALVGGGTVAMKAAFVAVELAGVAVIAKIWDAESSTKTFALAIYALNPLVFYEVAWSGHLDVLAWMPLTIAMLLVATRPATLRWGVAAGALLGVSIAAKLLGLLFLPYLALREPQKILQTLGHRAAVIIVALGVAAGSYAGFADAGPKLFQGFGTYAASWRSNDSLFRGFTAIASTALQDGDDAERIFTFHRWDDEALAYGFTKDWDGKTLPDTSFSTHQIAQTIGKLLALFIVGLLMLWCIAALRDPIRATLLLLLCLYFVAPTVHPWYVAWLVPLAALRPSPTALAFSGATVAAYVAWLSEAAGGPWAIPWWVVTVEFALVGAVLLWEAGRTLSSGR